MVERILIKPSRISGYYRFDIL